MGFINITRSATKGLTIAGREDSSPKKRDLASQVFGRHRDAYRDESMNLLGEYQKIVQKAPDQYGQDSRHAIDELDALIFNLKNPKLDRFK